MKAVVASLALLFVPAAATANPTRCSDLAPRKVDRLAADAQRRFPGAADWAETVKPWRQLLVDIDLDRAPHIARAILADCPGVQLVQPPASIDPRNFRSSVIVRVTSFAALTRIAQLPAVASMRVTDPTIRIKEPMRGDPIFDDE